MSGSSPGKLVAGLHAVVSLLSTVVLANWLIPLKVTRSRALIQSRRNEKFASAESLTPTRKLTALTPVGCAEHLGRGPQVHLNRGILTPRWKPDCALHNKLCGQDSDIQLYGSPIARNLTSSPGMAQGKF